MEKEILANAELVRTVARAEIGLAVDYDEAGVRWLDGYINRQRHSVSQETREKLPNTLGSYLGECIRQSFGGTWIHDQTQGWGVKVNENVTAFPFNKVRKQLAHSEGDSVLSFYTAIPALNTKPTAS